MKLGNTISLIRKQKKISQYLLAEKVNISQTYLSLIENEKKTPNILTLKKICKELNIPLPILFFRSMEETDIPDNKKKIFTEIVPFINSFIDNIFVIS